MPRESAETTYRSIHVTRLLRDRQVGRPPKGNTQRFGVVRLAAPRWRHAITLLIDWDRAVNEGWPDLRSPELGTSGASVAVIKQASTDSPEMDTEIA